MSDLSKTSRRTTFGVSAKPTSSPEAACGPSPLASPDGPTPANSGPARARVSRSPSQAKAPASMTSGICGQTFFGSSVPPGPLSSWENRLRERLAMVGSTEFDLTWKEKVTPAGASISRLAPSTRRTSGSDCIGWRTPATQEPGVSIERLRTLTGEPWTPGQRAYDVLTGRVCQIGLTHEVQASWPTPCVPNGGRKPKGGAMSMTGMTPDGKKRQVDLQWVAQHSASPRATPTVQDAENTAGPSQFNRNSHALNVQAVLSEAPWPTPGASDGEKGGPGMQFRSGQGLPLPAQAFQTAHSGQITSGEPAQTEKRGALSPEFVFWLMGFPDEWVSCALEAMPLFQKSRQKSSPR